jgi:putative transposase
MHPPAYPPIMNLTPFTSLSWAYQLHYYLCFRTYRRRRFFQAREELLKQLVREICERHDYHLLECQPFSDQLRCLVSLRPSQCVAKTIQTIKSNAARESARQLRLKAPLWARGYLARSVGHVRREAVRKYLEQQPTHHGYDSRVRPPVYRFRAPEPVCLKSAHASFELNHHLLLATSQRKGVFSSTLGKSLSEYWLRVAAKHDFAIDQLSVVPDHVHLLVRILPSMSIEECALVLMNNGRTLLATLSARLDRGWNQPIMAK